MQGAKPGQRRYRDVAGFAGIGLEVNFVLKLLKKPTLKNAQCYAKMPNTQQILYILRMFIMVKHTPCCPVTLKFVLCPFLIGGLYFQYLPAHSGTEVWEGPTSWGYQYGKAPLRLSLKSY